ncbi:hypothetical protein [Paenibacillus agilis]|uniref:Uncharacterized protein n=1 Tax=Paenibacillus agilis TaxID=3020863 RepID=A0A559IXB4_9BACL|nr:hypothetical protein [Paenibacillus agilis]TVX92274.1 hypothetical protein FPZ44_03865 [Paenibacillus agilis]
MDNVTSDYSNISEHVARYIDGPYGRIGIIVPDREATYDEWVDLHRTLAEIAVKSARRVKKPEVEEAAAHT